MVSPLNLTLSALHAFGRKLGAAADRISKAGTEGGDAAGSPVREERGAAGPAAARQAAAAHALPARRPAEPDLSAEIPAMITTVYGFKANLKAVQTQDEALGHLLNTLA